MCGRRVGLVGWVHDHRAQYNRWAGRHTWLIAAVVAVLLASLIIVIAGRVTPPQTPVQSVSGGPHTDQVGRDR
jgi:hypothetical protein